MSEKKPWRTQHLGTGTGRTLCGRPSGFTIPAGVDIPTEDTCKTCKKIAAKAAA